MEVYTNQFLRNLTSGYTAGDTSLHVDSAAPVAVQTGTFRARLANTSNTILKVTAGAATTTWTVAAEANDANCSSGNSVLACEWSAGAVDAVRADQCQTGARASATTAKAGNLYLPNDGVSILRDTGSAFAGWGPIYPLSAPAAFSNWSWLNQGTASGGDINGGIYLRAPSVGGTNLRVLKKSLGSPPYTIVMAFLETMFAGGNTRSGMVLYESTSGKLTTFGPSGDSARSIDHWNSTTSFASGTAGFALHANVRSPLVFWRIVNDNTNLTFSISADGQQWVQIFQESKTAFFSGAATDAGIFIDSEGSTLDVVLSLIHSTGF